MYRPFSMVPKSHRWGCEHICVDHSNYTVELVKERSSCSRDHRSRGRYLVRVMTRQCADFSISCSVVFRKLLLSLHFFTDRNQKQSNHAWSHKRNRIVRAMEHCLESSSVAVLQRSGFRNFGIDFGSSPFSVDMNLNLTCLK